MEPDIRLVTGFMDHYKTVILRRRLGSDAVLCLITLWMWAANNRPNGLLSGMNNEAIEAAARWNGEPGVFASTLVKLHWLDGEEGDYSLHGWTEHNTHVAGMGLQADRNRFRNLAKYHKDIYQELRARGVTSLTKEEYGELVAGLPSDAERENTDLNEHFDDVATLDDPAGAASAATAAAAPSIPTMTPHQETIQYHEERALEALAKFPAPQEAGMDEATALKWVRSMKKKHPRTVLYAEITEAAQWVRAHPEKVKQVKSVRGFMTKWLENLESEQKDE